MRKTLVVGAVILAIAGTLVACSSSKKGGSSAVDFHGVANPLPGFSYDTGWIPSSGPLQVDFAATATGTTTIDAGATLAGSTLTPTAGSGKLALALSFGLTGKLNVAEDGLTYMGPIPGLTNVSIAFSGTQTFDPFLIGGAAMVTASPASTMLPPIDLTPIGLPGTTLNLTIDPDSQVLSTFSGTCTGTAGGGQYVGEVTTSGTLKLSASLAFSALGVSKTLMLPSEISVPIPATNATVVLSPNGAPGTSCTADASDASAPPSDGPATMPESSTTEDTGSLPDTASPLDTGAQPDTASPPDTGSCTATGGACAEGVMPTCCSGNCDWTTSQCLGAGTYSVSIGSVAGTESYAGEQAAAAPEPATVYLYFTAPGLGPDTRVVVSVATVGSGCTTGAGGQGVEYQPDDGTGATYFDDGTPSCGLTITSVPSGPGAGTVAGTFSGTLTATTGTVQANFTFSLPAP